MLEVAELSLEPLSCGPMMGQLVVRLVWGSGNNLEPHDLMQVIGNQMSLAVLPVVVQDGPNVNQAEDMSTIVRALSDKTQVFTMYAGDKIPIWANSNPSNIVVITGKDWIDHRVMELYWIPQGPDDPEPHPGIANLRGPRQNERVHVRYAVLPRGWKAEEISRFMEGKRMGWRIMSERAFTIPAFKRSLL